MAFVTKKPCKFGKCRSLDIEVGVGDHSHTYQIVTDDSETGSIVSHNTLSLLGGCTPGCHPGIYEYFIRRIRMSSDSGLIDECKKQGYPVEFQRNFDGTPDRSTQIVSFPCKFPKGTIFAENFSAIEQMDIVKRLQREWSDNAVSCCLTANHYVHTKNGFYPIQDLSHSDEPKTYNDREIQVVNTDGRYEPSLHGYYNGLDSTIKVTLVGGKTIQGTKHHKIMCVDENRQSINWKTMKEITLNDRVVIRTNLNKWPTEKIANNILKQWEYNQKTLLSNICIPTIMTPKLAFWLGCILSDKYCTISMDGMVELTQIDNNVLNMWKQYTKDIFNVEPSVVENKHTGVCCVNIISQELNRWLKWLGIYDDNGKKIPQVIMSSSKSCVREFVRGLTLDGYVDEKEQQICITRSSNKLLLVQLDALMTNYGFNGHVHMSSNERADKSWTYTLKSSDAHRYIQIIGFVENIKNAQFAEQFKTKTASKNILGEIQDMGYRKQFRKNILPNINNKYIYEHFRNICYHNDKEISREVLGHFADMGLPVNKIFIDPTYQFLKVVYIENFEKMVPTYDITVDKTHSYLVNGIITHNTVYYKPNELQTIREYLNEHYYKNFKSISFLLHQDHGFAQAPYEEITEEEFNKMSANCKPISSTTILFSKKDDDIAAEPVCAGGMCPIK